MKAVGWWLGALFHQLKLFYLILGEALCFGTASSSSQPALFWTWRTLTTHSERVWLFEQTKAGPTP